MKKEIKFFITILLSTLITFLVYNIVKKIQLDKKTNKNIKILPNFSFKDIKGNDFKRSDLINEPVIFIYFNSDCDFCKSEAAKIQKRLTDFKNVQLIFVSFEEKEMIEKFATEYKLDNKENVLFLEDKKGVFSELFDVKSIPYIVVYNKNKELLKKFKGATKIDDILKVLR